MYMLVQFVLLYKVLSLHHMLSILVVKSYPVPKVGIENFDTSWLKMSHLRSYSLYLKPIYSILCWTFEKTLKPRKIWLKVNQWPKSALRNSRKYHEKLIIVFSLVLSKFCSPGCTLEKMVKSSQKLPSAQKVGLENFEFVARCVALCFTTVA